VNFGGSQQFIRKVTFVAALHLIGACVWYSVYWPRCWLDDKGNAVLFSPG